MNNQNVNGVSMCFNSDILDSAQIKHAVVKRVNKRWYIFMILELPDLEMKRSPTGRQVGIDVGLKSFAALSTGEMIIILMFERKPG